MAASNFLMEKQIKHSLGMEEFVMPTSFELALIIEGADAEELKQNLLEHEVDSVDYQRIDVTGKFTFDPDKGSFTLSETVTFLSMPEVTVRFLAVLNDNNIFYFARSAAPIEIAQGQDFPIQPEDFEVSGV